MLLGIYLFLLFTSPIWINLLYKYSRYNRSLYKKETNLPFSKIVRDKGLVGEYYSAEILAKSKGYHKLVLNCYLPSSKGETSEIDLIFLHETGIYVLESKNYSGWIFGSDQDKKWCQRFRNGHKEFFYNPIKQNQTHIRVLRTLLDFVPAEHFHSVIVFSERCELKKVTVDSPNVVVLKRNQLYRFINDSSPVPVFTKDDIDHMYQMLKPYCNAADEVKEQHIRRVSLYK